MNFNRPGSYSKPKLNSGSGNGNITTTNYNNTSIHKTAEKETKNQFYGMFQNQPKKLFEDETDSRGTETAYSKHYSQNTVKTQNSFSGKNDYIDYSNNTNIQRNLTRNNSRNNTQMMGNMTNTNIQYNQNPNQQMYSQNTINLSTIKPVIAGGNINYSNPVSSRMMNNNTSLRNFGGYVGGQYQGVNSINTMNMNMQYKI